MKLSIKFLPFLVLIAGSLAPALPQDFGAALSGGGNGGSAAFRLASGRLSYQIFLDGSPTGVSVGGTNLNATFDGGFTAGSVPFSGNPEGAQITFTGSSATGTLVRSVGGGGNGGGGDGGGGDGGGGDGGNNEPIDTGDTSACVLGPETLCLAGGRFEVTVSFTTQQGTTGNAQVIQQTDDTGIVWFFDPTNLELLIKVLDGCAVNDSWWVFHGGTTDQGVGIRVRDTSNGLARDYSNPVRTNYLTVTDTGAFPTSCP
ncbi:MAG: hypothetical protein AAF690_21940 [Acidobacteriota bacterium]